MATATIAIATHDRVEWKNDTGSAVVVDEIVVWGVGQVGIALVAIADGKTGAVMIGGHAYNFPKAAGTLAQGVRLYWDGTNAVILATANDFIGLCYVDALTGDTTVKAILIPGEHSDGN